MPQNADMLLNEASGSFLCVLSRKLGPSIRINYTNITENICIILEILSSTLNKSLMYQNHMIKQ